MAVSECVVFAGETGIGADVSAAVVPVLELLAEGAVDQAVGAIEAVNRQSSGQAHPGSALSSYLVGLLSLRLGEPGKALEAFNLAYRLAPEVAEYTDALSILHAKLGHVVDALYFGKLTKAATIQIGIPGLVPGWLGNFAQAFFSMQETPLLTRAKFFASEEMHGLAAQEFRRAIEVDPRNAEAWRGLVSSCQRQNLPFDALEASFVLLEQDAIKAKDIIRHGDLLADCGQLDRAIQYVRGTAAALPDVDALVLAPIRSLSRLPDPDAALTEFTAGLTPPDAATKPHPASPTELQSRRLRLGVISSQWQQGAGLDPVVPVLEWLERRLVELIVYADDEGASILAKRLRRRADTWHDITELDDETLTFVIRNDAPDLLIDLDGPIRNTRPGLFRQYPASLSLSLYGSADLAAPLGFDGVILPPNRDLIPDDTNLKIVLASLASLPTDLPAQIPDYVPHEGPPIFGTLAPFGAMTPETVTLWADLLRSIPGSTLRLDPTTLGGIEAAEELKAALGDTAVTIVEPGEDGIQTYLSQIDVALDPPDNPFCDRAFTAFGYGVPVFTCASRNKNAALLFGWLTTIGLTDLALPNQDAVLPALLALNDPPARASLRNRIADAMTTERNTGAKHRANTATNAFTKLVHVNAKESHLE